MVTLALACSLVAVGPELDPIRGATVDAGDRALLPGRSTWASIADLWLLEAVNLSPSGAGLELYDPLTIAAYGWSWTETRFSFDGLDITDPARPGNPLIELPGQAWETLTLHSLWSAGPRLDAALANPASEPLVAASLRGGGEVGGGTWIPRGFMDREPATRFGATSVRRAVRRAVALDAAASTGSTQLYVEHVGQQQRYPTLTDSAGRRLDEPARRTTVLAVATAALGTRPLRLVAGWQHGDRGFAGAQDRLPAALTAQQTSHALLTQAHLAALSTRWLSLQIGAGLGWRWDRAPLRGTAPIVADLEQEWTWLHRPRFGEEVSRGRVDLGVVAGLGADRATSLGLSASRQELSSRPTVPGGRTARVWRRAAVDPSVSVDVYAPTRVAEEQLFSLRLEAETVQHLGGLAVTAVAALDAAAVDSVAGPGLGLAAPAAGLASRWPLGDGELFGLVRHEPVPLTAQVSAFLDPARPSFRRYAWSDDGDLVPEPGETGALLARFGGDAYRAGPGLVRPTSTQLALGWRSPRFGPFRFVATGVARMLHRRFVVRLAGAARSSYRRATAADFAGDQLERGTLWPTDLDLDVFAREPGTEGAEVYQLENAHRDHHLGGAEIQLRSEPGRPWFLNLMATGYWSLGCTPFGLFADRNDPGVVDAVTADPNARVNQCGSVDSGRAYHINLMTGLEPADGLSLALLLRYRDGEPLARVAVVEGLPQGATAVMTQRRGDPVPRFTFHMTVDVRARYQLRTGPVALALFLDAYNLFGSGTEILEDVSTSADFRRSLEMMPGRTLFAGIEGEVP